MKQTLKLKLETRLNAILFVDKMKFITLMSTDLDMSLLDWMIKTGKNVEYKSPNLLDFELKYQCCGSNDTHKMSSYLYDTSKYTLFVNVIE